MKKFSRLLIVMSLTICSCLPMTRENLEKTLDSEVFKSLFSKSELVEIGGRYASYADSAKKRLIATAPTWAVGLVVGFSSNVLPTENRTLVESNIIGGLGLAAIGGTIKAVGGEDTKDALQKLHHSSEGEVVIAATAGYITGALFGRLVNKTGRVIIKGTQYGWQITRPTRNYCWQKLVNAIVNIKLKLQAQAQPEAAMQEGREVGQRGDARGTALAQALARE